MTTSRSRVRARLFENRPRRGVDNSSSPSPRRPPRCFFPLPRRRFCCGRSFSSRRILFFPTTRTTFSSSPPKKKTSSKTKWTPSRTIRSSSTFLFPLLLLRRGTKRARLSKIKLVRNGRERERERDYLFFWEKKQRRDVAQRTRAHKRPFAFLPFFFTKLGVQTRFCKKKRKKQEVENNNKKKVQKRNE